MNKWGITVKCETEGQASNLAKLIKTQTGLEVNVKGGSSMSIDLDCRHPPDKVKEYRRSQLCFCTQCNQRVIEVSSWETRKDGRLEGTRDDCFHPPDGVSSVRIERGMTNDCFGERCDRCGYEVEKVQYYLLPDLSDAPSKLLNADGDAPGIDHLLVMPERVDDTAVWGEPAEA